MVEFRLPETVMTAETETTPGDKQWNVREKNARGLYGARDIRLYCFARANVSISVEIRCTRRRYGEGGGERLP